MKNCSITAAFFVIDDIDKSSILALIERVLWKNSSIVDQTANCNYDKYSILKTQFFPVIKEVSYGHKTHL